MLVIGTSWIGTPAQTSFHSDRVISPCNLLTPLACRLRRSARMVMLNGSSGLRRVWPYENSSSNGIFSSLAKFPKYFRIISRGNESLPAGTGVCGENVRGSYQLEGRIKIEFLFHDVETNAFKCQKRRMPFVHVKHRRLNAERSERFNTPYSEHDLLTHAHLKVATVKLSSDQSVLSVVFRNVCVEEIEAYLSEAQFPELRKTLRVQNGHRINRFPIATESSAVWEV